MSDVMTDTAIQQSDKIRQGKDFMQVVSFRLAGEYYAVEIKKVKEIIMPEGVTHVPQMPEFIEGIINLRGNVIPVIDLRKRFDLPSEAQTDHTRIVVVRMENKIIGAIVDSVSQVMKIPKSQIQPPPETIAGLAGEYLTGVAKMESGMILLLDIEKVMSAHEKAALLAKAPEVSGTAVAS